MRRLKLTLAYDGRPFAGWQSQANGRGVQDFLEKAVVRVCGERVCVHGSGRTDSGVHALGQIAHFDPPEAFRQLPARQWLKALNAYLPPEIRVLRTQWARAGFHARFSAQGKTYVYRIWDAPVLPPLEIGRAWHLYTPLDMPRLRAGVRLLAGTHDFAGFAANRGVPCADTVRTLRRIRIQGAPGGLITLTFTGTGFLYRMVRLLTGSLVRVAQGKAELDWLEEVLTVTSPGHPKRKTSFAAPAEGLYLEKVLY